MALLLPCPLHRLVTWVQSSFSVKASLGRGEAIEACLMSLRDRSPLVIRAALAGQQMQVGSRQYCSRCRHCLWSDVRVSVAWLRLTMWWAGLCTSASPPCRCQLL